MRRTYQEHDSGLEEQPEVVRFPVREGGFLEHLAVSHTRKQSASTFEAFVARNIPTTYEKKRWKESYGSNSELLPCRVPSNSRPPRAMSTLQPLVIPAVPCRKHPINRLRFPAARRAQSLIVLGRRDRTIQGLKRRGVSSSGIYRGFLGG